MGLVQTISGLLWLVLFLAGVVNLRAWRVPVGAHRRLRRGHRMMQAATVAAFTAAIAAVSGEDLPGAAALLFTTSATAAVATLSRLRIDLYVTMAQLHAEAMMLRFAQRNGLPMVVESDDHTGGR